MTDVLALIYYVKGVKKIRFPLWRTPNNGKHLFLTYFRLYHYSTSQLPMPPHAILQPSTEDLMDPPWLKATICRMIDEFSDVNEGEKDFFKMWDLHVQHYT